MTRRAELPARTTDGGVQLLSQPALLVLDALRHGRAAVAAHVIHGADANASPFAPSVSTPERRRLALAALIRAGHVTSLLDTGGHVIAAADRWPVLTLLLAAFPAVKDRKLVDAMARSLSPVRCFCGDGSCMLCDDRGMLPHQDADDPHGECGVVALNDAGVWGLPDAERKARLIGRIVAAGYLINSEVDARAADDDGAAGDD